MNYNSNKHRTMADDIRVIWENHLYIGEKLRMSFESPAERDYFKVRLHQLKKKSEEMLLGIGAVEEVTSIYFKHIGETETELLYEIVVDTRRKPRTWFFTIVPDDDDKET